MSDKKLCDAPFTNEDTIVRRAWIDTALASVRGRLGSLYPDPDAATAGTGIDGEFSQSGEVVSGESAECSKPQLYVAWSAPQRRSGT